MSSKSKSGSDFFSKVNISEVFLTHLKTLKKYRGSSYSKADIFLFFVLPGIITATIIYANVRLTENLAGILINVFAILAGFLFNLLVLVYEVVSKAVRKDSSVQENTLSLDRLEEISSNVSFEIVLSIFSLLFLVTSNGFSEGISNAILSSIVFYLFILFILTLFMILKRVHKLLLEEIVHQRKTLIQ
jgi:hypothetical protein